MSENIPPSLNGVAETLLITLYLRAQESQRPDALVKDEQAETLVNRLNYDFSHLKGLSMDEEDKISIILRTRQFDRFVLDFLQRYPRGTVVHIGCGLDSRFERVDNGLVTWYDLDLPQVIELRRSLLGDEKERHHHLSFSMFDPAWLDIVSALHPQNILFLAEGVFQYFTEEQIKSLVLALNDRFPGAELVFDALSPYAVFIDNLRISRTNIKARYNWGLKNGHIIEGWRDGIRLLESWGYFDQPEPRLQKVYWMRHIPVFANVSRIYHYRLGEKK